MAVESTTWYPFSWYCPNCGDLTRGYKNKEGTIKVECGSCHAVMVRTFKGRRHNRIDIYAPVGEINDPDDETAFAGI